MPSLGADMAAGTLVAWRVAPGQRINRGEVVAEVETEKGLIEIECFEAGVVEALHATPGTKVGVGARLATVRPDGAAATATPTRSAAPPGAPSLAAVSPAAPAAGGPPPSRQPQDATRPDARGRVRASPAARARATALGIDLAGVTVTGTGPGGAIEIADVERAATAAGSAGAGAATPADGLAPIRRAIAAAMSRSKREIPHYYLESRIDVSVMLAWLQRENASRGIAGRVLPAVVLLKATARALRDVPALNGHWVDGQHRIADRVHLGFAIALRGGGLVAPALHDVDRKTCDALMTELRDLIPRARAGRLRSSEMTDATATVTSLGELGVESVLGVIYPPQVALIGFGRILDQPWAEHGAVVVRPVVTATLAADHRATDGHLGARFLDALRSHLHAPDTL